MNVQRVEAFDSTNKSSSFYDAGKYAENSKETYKKYFEWSWLMKLIIVIIGISLSIFLIWASFELFIKNNERARSQIHLHEKEEEVVKKK